MSEQHVETTEIVVPGSIGVLILAGGKGTRLRMVLSDRPKCLAHINGRPFLSYQFDLVQKAGFRNVLLCTGYLAEIVRGEFGDRHELLDIEYSEELFPLGTGGALRLALEKSNADYFLVLNGDSFCEIDLSRFIQECLPNRIVNMVLAEVNDSTRFGGVETACGGKIKRFIEKGSVTSGWINAGIYLIPRTFLEGIDSGKYVSLENDVFPNWIQSSNVCGYKSYGKFIDIGTPESLRKASEFFKENQ